MITNIVLFGHTGMLGRYVYSYFRDSEFLVHIVNGFRVTKDTTVSDIDVVLKGCEVDETTCVINCIGAIPQRETAPQQFYLVNGVFPHLLWSACQKYGCKMIQPTTDCVFSGKKGRYLETDEHDETGHYGISKSLGEPAGCTVLRTSIIGEELANKRSFLEFVKNSTGQIKGWTNHMWNGITCLQYCKVLNEILTNYTFWTGVRHIASPTAASKYEMACMIHKTYGLSFDILEASTPEPCDKTLSTIHESSIEIPELSVQIDDLRNFDITRDIMSWSSKDGRIALGNNTYTTTHVLEKPENPNPLPAWAGPNTTQLQIETLMSNKQKIAYIKRNLHSGKFYDHVRIQKQPVTSETVSIVMTSANRSRQTLYTLETIARSTYTDVQVILVDDSTTDPIHASQLEGYPFTIDFIHIKKDGKIWGNPCVNYNIGFKFVEGGKVVIQNAEVCHVGNVLQYVHDSVHENSYVVFDVASISGFDKNEIIYSKNVLTSDIYSEESMYNGFKWYQSTVHRNVRYHFLTAMVRSTFDQIGGFSYDYTIGNGYDDNDLVLKIEYLGIPILSVAHTDVACGGLHLFHVNSGGSWGGKLPLNDIVFAEKQKKCRAIAGYIDLLSI
jgi:dTDP-4-dehydrorhamnose reductase